MWRPGKIAKSSRRGGRSIGFCCNVCGYKMNMKHPITEETHHLFHDADPSTPMFRVVVKANLSMPMADNLVASIKKSFAFLDAHGAGFNSHPHHAHQPHHKAC